MVRRAIDFTPADVARRSVRGAVALGARQVITQGANALGGVLLARMLSPTQFGLFTVLAFVVSFLTSFAGTGLAASLIRESREPAEEDVRALFTVQELAVLALTVASIVAAPGIAAAYRLPPQDAWLFRLVSFSFALASFTVIPQVRLERQLEFGRLALVEITQALAYNATVVLLAWQGWGGLGVGLALFLRSAVGAAMVTRISPWTPAFRWDWPRARAHLAFGLPYQGVAAVSLIKDSITPVFLGILLGTQSVGYISWASLIATYPVLALLALQRIYLPTFARLQAAPGLPRYVEQTIAATNALVAPFAVLTLVFIEPITHFVFGAKWQAAIPMFYILWTANLSVATATPVIGLLNALGRSRTTFLFAVACASTMWGIGIPLARAFGAIGIAWADLAVQVPTILLFGVAQRCVEFRIVPLALPPWLWASSLGLIFFGLQHLRPVTGLPGLVMYLACGVILYALGVAAAYRHNLGQFWGWWKQDTWIPVPR
jgi:O-antigen/teichoic acid export membrane protein